MTKITLFFVAFFSSFAVALVPDNSPKSLTFTTPTKNNDEVECFICLQPLRDTEKKALDFFVCSTPNHCSMMHKKCAYQWILSADRAVCPLCKAELNATTLLYEAIDENNSRFLKKLLQEHHININAVSKGKNPLYYAVFKKNLTMVRILLAAPGIDVNGRGLPWKPLSLAVLDANIPIIEELLKAGADMHVVDDDGMSAFDYAYTFGNQEVIKILSESLLITSLRQPSLHSITGKTI